MVLLNYLTTAEVYPDKFSAILGKSEISFTFDLSDNILLNRYNSHNGESMGTYKGRTTDIGQDKDG